MWQYVIIETTHQTVALVSSWFLWFLVHLGPFFYNDNKISSCLGVCVWLYMTFPLSFPGFTGCVSDKQQCFLNQPNCSFHSSIHLDALSHYSGIADDNVSLQYCRSVDIDLKILPVNKSEQLFVSSGISSCQTTTSPADMKAWHETTGTPRGAWADLSRVQTCCVLHTADDI